MVGIYALVFLPYSIVIWGIIFLFVAIVQDAILEFAKSVSRVPIFSMTWWIPYGALVLDWIVYIAFTALGVSMLSISVRKATNWVPPTAVPDTFDTEQAHPRRIPRHRRDKTRS